MQEVLVYLSGVFAFYSFFLRLFSVNFFVGYKFLGASQNGKKETKQKNILFQLLKSIHTGVLFSFSADDFITNRRLKLLHFVFNQTSFSS